MIDIKQRFESVFDDYYFDEDLGNEELFPSKIALINFIKKLLQEQEQNIVEQIIVNGTYNFQTGNSAINILESGIFKKRLDERTKEIKDIIVEANNFTNAQVLDRDEWNRAMFQAQSKINAVISKIDDICK